MQLDYINYFLSQIDIRYYSTFKAKMQVFFKKNLNLFEILQITSKPPNFVCKMTSQQRNRAKKYLFSELQSLLIGGNNRAGYRAAHLSVLESLHALDGAAAW